VAAAAFKALNWLSALVASAGLMSTATRRGDQLMQQLQPLCRQLDIEKIYTGCVAAGSGEAGDDAKPHRIIEDAENDGDRRRRCLGGQRRRGTTGSSDHGHVSPHQIGR
jgi:hypothetical protein